MPGPTRPRTSERLRGSVRISYTLGRDRRAAALGAAPHRGLRERARRAHRQPGGADGPRRPEGDLPLAAGRWRRTPTPPAQMYPDQSLYPVDSVPERRARINQALRRADQIEHAEGRPSHYWIAPIVADAEAGFGGPLNAFELMKAMIEAGAAGVHFEDQLASEKKCGHMGGKVLVPTSAVRPHARRRAARRRRLRRAHPPGGPHRRRQREAPPLRRRPARPRVHRPGRADARGLLPAPRRARVRHRPRRCAYAPYADVLWCETSTPGHRRGPRVRRGHPREVPEQAPRLQLLALVQLEEEPRRRDDRQVPARARGHGLQVPVRHPGRLPRAELLDVQPGPRLRARTAWRRTASCSRPSSRPSRRATPPPRHQREVGTGYFDEVAQVIAGGAASTLALTESTETEQF